MTDDADPATESDPTAADNERPDAIDDEPEPVIFTEHAIAQRLAEELHEIDFRGVPLADFVDFVGQLTGLTLAFDLDALAAAGVTPEEPLNLHLQQVDVKTALTAALAEFELTYELVDGVLLITRPRHRRDQINAVKYETADGTDAGNGNSERLASLLRSVVAPLTWRERGGRGFVEITENGLTIHQTEAVHHSVADLIASLRATRRDAGGAFPQPILGSRRRLAHDKLLSPVTAHFPDPTPIKSILGFLSDQTDTRLVLDSLALRQEGRATHIETTLFVNRLTLAEVALYYVGDLLRDGLVPASLVAEIKSNVAPGGWDEEPGAGVVQFDERSACLLVWHSQPVQVEVDRLLESKRSPAGPQTEPAPMNN
jgi:hypothetical protein